MHSEFVKCAPIAPGHTGELPCRVPVPCAVVVAIVVAERLWAGQICCDLHCSSLAVEEGIHLPLALRRRVGLLMTSL